MADGLARVGIQGAYDGALKYVGNPKLISRSHFARYLVEIGVCADVRQVFGSYLIQGKPGYVPHRWARLSEAIGWIRSWRARSKSCAARSASSRNWARIREPPIDRK